MVYQTKQKPAFRLATWQVIIVFGVLSVVTATMLRINNVKMSERKEAVLAADATGDLGLVAERLHELQEFVFAHMNASTGTIFLETTYLNRMQQLVDDAKNTIGSNPEKNAYKIAAEVCDKKFAGYTTAYAQCFLDEVNKNDTTISQSLEIRSLNPMLFTHSYAAPTWSADWAGFSVLAWLIMLLYLIGKILIWAILRLIIAKKS